MRRLGCALAAALAFAFSTAAGAADEEIVAQGEALVKAGRYADAYQLLEPLEDRLAGDLKYDYLLARSALETNRPSKASFIYERILAVEPNYVGVRLEMGRAYLALGDYARAKLEFEAVLRFENLPPGLREQALVYDKAAADYISGKKTVFNGYAELGYGYDSNVQSATSTTPITLAGGLLLNLEPEFRKRGDQYTAFATGGEVVHTLTPNFSAFGGADLRWRAYRDIDAADNYSLDARLGLGYAEGAHNTRIGVAGGRYWLNDEKTRDNSGMNLDYRYLAGRQDQFSFGFSGANYHFVQENLKVNDFNLRQYSVGWLHGTASGQSVVGLTLLGGVENATNERPDGDKHFFGGRLIFQTAPSTTWGVFFVGGAQRGKYSQVNALFDLTREDTLYDATVGVTWSFTKGWSLRPQVVYLKNKSNLPLFEFDRIDTSLNLRWDF